MKSGEKKLLFVETITLIVLIINAFFLRIFNYYTLTCFLGAMLVITILLVGFERERFLNKKKNIRIILTFTISLLMIKFGFGMITGFLLSGYNRTLSGIIRNGFPVLLIVLVSEIFRYTLITKGEKNKLVFILSIIIFTLAYLNITTNLLNLTSLRTIVEIFTTDVLTVLFENIALSFLSKNYGYSGALSYSLIMNLYVYIVPFIPNLGSYLDASIMIGFPIVTLIFSNYLLQSSKKEDYDPRNKHIFARLIRLMLVFCILILVGLNSNIFRYWIAVIASGSMEPTIEVGDVIIIDKDYKNHVDKIKEDDVVVFTMNGKIYTHRVVKENIKNGEYSFVTKGDRKGQDVDQWTVTKTEIVGITRHTIKYVGLPAIWLRNAIERN